jgi:hypothetical protein
MSPFGSRAKDYWANDHVQGSGQCFRLVAGACRRWWCWECGARHRFQGVGSGIFARVSFIRRKLEASLSKMCPMIVRGPPPQPRGSLAL